MNELNSDPTVWLLNSKLPTLVMEYQIESERGFQILGSSVYSSNALLEFDPPHFTSLEGERLGTTLTDFEVPDETWVWTWPRWYVDMTADVDDQGWSYSWRFRSSSWSGRHRFMRSFVRQRLWKRPRVKREVLMGKTLFGHEIPKSLTIPDLPGLRGKSEVIQDRSGSENRKHPRRVASKDAWNRRSSCHEELNVRRELAAASEVTAMERKLEEEIDNVAVEKEHEILEYIRGLRNDREKVDGIMNYIKEHPDELALLADIREKILMTLSFPMSRRTLIARLSESQDPSYRSFLLAPAANWREQVLRNGQPDSVQDSDDLSLSGQIDVE